MGRSLSHDLGPKRRRIGERTYIVIPSFSRPPCLSTCVLMCTFVMTPERLVSSTLEGRSPLPGRFRTSSTWGIKSRPSSDPRRLCDDTPNIKVLTVSKNFTPLKFTRRRVPERRKLTSLFGRGDSVRTASSFRPRSECLLSSSDLPETQYPFIL